MSLRSRFTLTPSITLWLVGLIAMGHLHLAWAGGDLPKLRSESLQPVPVQTEPRLTQSTTGSSQSQPSSQSKPNMAVEGQEASSQAIFSTRSMTGPGRLELGVMGGEPMGLSAKLWLSPTRAIDAGLGWSMIGDDTNLQLHADYLFHSFDLLRPVSGSLPLYAGMGARFRFGEDSRFGFRVPIGIEYISASRTVSLSLEAGPVINFIPTADVDVNFGLGMRFFFLQPDDKSKAVS